MSNEARSRRTMVAPAALFLRCLGLVYVAAFASLAVQMRGLFGSHGILPVVDYLDAVRSAVESHRVEASSPFWFAPSIFWLSASDQMLTLVPWIGAGLGAAIAAGLFQAPFLLLAWMLYLSICSVGQTFLGFQWDALLLETGFLAIFLAPWRLRTAWRDSPAPSVVVVWLLRFLLFRLLFASGVVKLSSGDPTWHNLQALEFHYETQPLPTWTSFFMHQLPAWFQHASCLVMFAIELVFPFGMFLPRPARLLSFAGLFGLQLLIGATGNYGFFNLLTMALCLLCLDDACLPSMFRPATAGAEGATIAPWRRVLAAGPATVWLGLSANVLFYSFGWRGDAPAPVRMLERVAEPVSRFIQPLDLIHSYGLFASMTTERPEIIVEGSADGVMWKQYAFKYKEGDPQHRPEFVTPHMPRLDWQMWFAALGSWQRNRWFGEFLDRLLDNSPDVLGLLAQNPFPEKPPRYVRATLYDYRFTTLSEWRATGKWWRVSERGLYGPSRSLEASGE